MTAIIAWHDGHRGYMAADRRCCSGFEICTDSASKIVRCGRWLIGCSGETLADDFVRANAERIGQADSATGLSETLREIFSENGWSPRQRGDSVDAPQIGSSFLAVHHDLGAFVVFYNLSVRRQDRPCQTGSGGDSAQGAFEALRRQGVDIKAAMSEAIKIAASFNASVGGEPEVVTTDAVEAEQPLKDPVWALSYRRAVRP